MRDGFDNVTTGVKERAQQYTTPCMKRQLAGHSEEHAASVQQV